MAIVKGLVVTGNAAVTGKISEEGTLLENKYKQKQTAVTSPTASGNATAFIDTISQDAQGVISATKKNIDLSGVVTGVKVNNSSVVTNQVANIPLSNGTSTAGAIKTTSTVTSTSGLTACPVISGVPYYVEGGSSTDEKVKQTESDSDGSYPILISNLSTPTSGHDYQSLYNSRVRISPGQYSILFGKDAVVGSGNAYGCFAFGHAEEQYIKVYDVYGSMAFGFINKADPSYLHDPCITAQESGAFAGGYITGFESKGISAKGLGSMAFGYSTSHELEADGKGAIALGRGVAAVNDGALATGYNTRAEGENSAAMGKGTVAKNGEEFVIGRYNDAAGSGQLFTIGNGTNANNPHTVFSVYDDQGSLGNSVVVDIDGDVYAANFVPSDIRKKNILGDISLDKAYDLIDKCQTILYTLKEDKTNKELLGLIAQEVQEFFPELIGKKSDGTLVLDYARLTVIIFKVLKDLIKRIEKLEEK